MSGQQASIKLHHTALRIGRNSLPVVIDLFQQLGMECTVKEIGYGWVMMSQGFDIQLSEVDSVDGASINRIKSHVGFLSDNPQAWIEKLEAWAESNGLAWTSGGWNQRERWFDLPDVFVDWVIEVMDEAVVRDYVDTQLAVQ